MNDVTRKSSQIHFSESNVVYLIPFSCIPYPSYSE